MELTLQELTRKNNNYWALSLRYQNIVI